MASQAGPPSGGSFEIARIMALVAEALQQVDAAWGGGVLISPAGKDLIMDFAAEFLSNLSYTGLPPGVDEDMLAQQVFSLVPAFLQSIRVESEISRSLVARPGGATELPLALMQARLPQYMAARCQCWPQ